MPALYDTLADWWPLFSPPADYAEEAAAYTRIFVTESPSRPRTMLELGAGGGNNASFMKRDFELTLVDPAPGMRKVSEALNPDCVHLPGDMRTFRAGRTFDAVFVHDAVCYLTTEADLRAAFETAAIHLVSGGVALFAPDATRETFEEGTETDGSDGDGRSIRWLEWTHDPDPTDTTYIAEYAIMLRDAAGETTVVHDRHVEGLFPNATWLRGLDAAGFDARIVPDPWGRALFFGVKR